MDFAESQALIHETYLHMNMLNEEKLGGDKFYQYFYSLLDNSSNFCSFSNAKLLKSIDAEWVEQIEAAMPSLHFAVTHPRKFIEEDREVVNVAMARNITSESIRHLIQHCNLIDEYREDGTVIPNRILNIYKEESLNVYENRFICTLIAELQYFVNRRYNVIFEASKDELGTFFEVKSRIDNFTEIIEYNLSVRMKEKQTDSQNERENDNIFARIVKIHQQVNMLAQTEFIKTMRHYPAVTHPIVKTNVIGKNRDYKKCHELWNFLQSYNRVGYKVNIVKQDPSISRKFETDIYNGIIRNYAMLHDNMEFSNEVTIGEALPEKEMDIKKVRQLLSEIVDGVQMSDADLRKLLAKELTAMQNKKRAKQSEIERLRRQQYRNMRRNKAVNGQKPLTLEDVELQKISSVEETVTVKGGQETFLSKLGISKPKKESRKKVRRNRK